MLLKISRILNESKARLSYGALPVLIGAATVRLIVFVIAYLFLELGLFFTNQSGLNDVIFETLRYTAFTLCGVTVILLCPLGVGFKRMTYECSKGNEIHIGDLFYYLRSVRLSAKSLCLYLRLFVALLPVILLIAVTWLVISIMESLLINSVPTMLPIYLIRAGKYTIILLETILLIIYAAKYSLAQYYLIDSDFGSISESIKKSVAVMTKYQMNSLTLVFSTLHLFLASVLAVPLLYTLPKLSTVFSVFAKTVIQLDNMNMYYMSGYGNRSMI